MFGPKSRSRQGLLMVGIRTESQGKRGHTNMIFPVLWFRHQSWAHAICPGNLQFVSDSRSSGKAKRFEADLGAERID